MRILITGGTGFIGSILIEAWHEYGHEVTVFGRSIKKKRRLPNKTDLDPLLDRIGMRRLGPVDFRGRARIKRGKLTLDQAMCTACGICYDVCPRGVYGIKRDGRKRVEIKYEKRCEACEACVVQCPRKAISLMT